MNRLDLPARPVASGASAKEEAWPKWFREFVEKLRLEADGHYGLRKSPGFLRPLKRAGDAGSGLILAKHLPDAAQNLVPGQDFQDFRSDDSGSDSWN
jgi:hypothetical protein